MKFKAALSTQEIEELKKEISTEKYSDIRLIAIQAYDAKGIALENLFQVSIGYAYMHSYFFIESYLQKVAANSKKARTKI